jgi:hypothetical protein
MPNRTLALVIKAVLVASVAAYATADVPESAAQQKKKKGFWDGIRCECMCVTGTETEVRYYDAVAHCSAYNRKACQIDDGNVVTTGSLSGCRGQIRAEVPRAGPTAGNEQAPPKPKRPKLAPTAPSSGRGTN